MSCESRFLEAAKAIVAAQPDSAITAEDLAMAFHLRQAKINPRSLEMIFDVAGIAMQDEVTVEDDQGDQPLRQFAADKKIKLKQVRSQVHEFQAQREKEEALADGTPLVIFGQGGEDCLRFFTGDDLKKWIDEAKFDKSGKQIKRFGNYSVVLECSDETEDRFVLDVIEGKKVLASYSGDTRADLWRDTELSLDIAATKANMARGGKAKKKLTGDLAAEVKEGIRTFSEDSDWIEGESAGWLYELASNLQGGGYGLDGAAADYISCSNDYENHPKNSRLREKTQELGVVLYKKITECI